MTKNGEPDDLETSTSPDAGRRRAFATLLMATPDVGDDADFERSSGSCHEAQRLIGPASNI